MWYCSILISALALKVATANEPNCEPPTELSVCYQRYYPTEYQELYGEAPDEEELKALCRNLVPFKQCVEDFMNECSLQNSSYTQAQLSVVGIMCNEDSQLRSDYLESVSCYKEQEDTVLYNECMYLAFETYHSYWDFLEKLENPPKFTYNNRYCLMKGYILGCISIRIKTECGEKAQNVFLELVQRSATLSNECLKVDKEDLNNGFLDFLEEDKKQDFSYAFQNMMK